MGTFPLLPVGILTSSNAKLSLHCRHPTVILGLSWFSGKRTAYASAIRTQHSVARHSIIFQAYRKIGYFVDLCQASTLYARFGRMDA